MPCENHAGHISHLTRSGRRDPIFETIVILQERIRVLERQIRNIQRNFSEYRRRTEDSMLYRHLRTLIWECYDLTLRVNQDNQIFRELGLSSTFPMLESPRPNSSWCSVL